MSLFLRRREASQFIPSSLRHISFGVLTPEQIINAAVKKITTPLTFDLLGHPIPGGLYDKALGPINDKSDPCGTCLKFSIECPGHFGYIELPLPVVNPIFHRLIGSIMKMSCTNCFTLQLHPLVKHGICLQMKLLDSGIMAEALEVEEKIFDIFLKYELQECVIDTEIIDYYNQMEQKVKEKEKETKQTEQLKQKCLNNINKFSKTRQRCIHCTEPLERVTFERNRITISFKTGRSVGDGIVVEKSHKYVNPNESKNFMRELWKKEREFLMMLAPILRNIKDNKNPTDIFYFEVLPVPPLQTRPANFVKGRITEHTKTNAYRAVLQNCIILKTIIQHIKGQMDEISVEEKAVYDTVKGENTEEKLCNVWEQLQTNIDDLLNKDTTKQKDFHGLKQIIEKKEGLLRMHMMGKRVNYSARSVITPDPNLKIDEVGIPDIFAKKLTFPTPVNSHNVEALRKMVMNGPNQHPGATLVKFQSGRMVRLDPKNAVQRESVAKQLLTPDDLDSQGSSTHKIVHRHMCNGDIVLMNRQPSLHKPSVMAHKVRILKNEKTLRLHYATCKAYNADFDGDEMNLHFPQTERARSEAYTLVNVSNQYLVPKDGTPLSGLIQDHIISGVKLPMRGKFFNRSDYHHLVFQGLYHKTSAIKLLPPALIKPERCWSGKQVLSTIIINLIPSGKALINLTSKSKIKPKDWISSPPTTWNAGGTEFKNEYTMSESEVIIRNGELLSGVIDKSQYGAFGLIHCMYELYGGACATEMLSSLTRVFNTFLVMEGFSLGILDILVTEKANKKRKKITKELRKVGLGAMRKALDLPQDAPLEDIMEKHTTSLVENPSTTAMVDRAYKTVLDSYTNSINTTCLSEGLTMKFPKNNLQLMVISGAKGSTVNTMQMSCCLGQIELEGKRPPMMISRKTLPSFPQSDYSPRAGGFIDGRFLTGIRPQEFFFHCMAGREGLIDTAVKTSRSGYLQRCLVKSLEGVHVKADLTVRDCDNTVIQFLYGGDGMDIGKAKFLSEKHLPFLHENMDAILNEEFIKESKSEEGLAVKEYAMKIDAWKEKHGTDISKKMIKPFTLFTEFVRSTAKKEVTTEQLYKLWINSKEDVKEGFRQQCIPCPDPLNSVFFPQSHFGAISTRIQELIDDYQQCKGKEDRKKFENMMKQKAMTALCDSGEAVGLLAAQSIGEPSTQMTLNTFHFAGRGEMNVTLGIPRLVEILIMASRNIKTPSMVIPFLENENLVQESDMLRKKFNRVTVSDVLKRVNVATKGKNGEYKYTLLFHFLPHAQYKDKYCINPKYIMKHMKKKFFKALFEVIRGLNKIKPGEVLKKQTEAAEMDMDIDDNGVEDNVDVPEQDSSDEEPEDTEDAKYGNKRRQKKATEDMEISDDEEFAVNKTVEINEDDADEEDLECMGKFKMDQEDHRWCQLTFSMPRTNKGKMEFGLILKDMADKSVIWEIPNIKKAITYMKDGMVTLRTDGINISEIYKHGRILNLNKLYCNDIHKIIEHFGISAGIIGIIKEIEDVFSVYGIEIDQRHLTLIADFMTSSGVFEPLNRAGMRGSVSPFQQMSFESSLNFLVDAVIKGKVDRLSNPSSSLMTGTECVIGTGGVDLMFDPFFNSSST